MLLQVVVLVQSSQSSSEMFATAALLALAGSAAAIPVIGNFTLEKRTYTNARFTWYDVDVGYGACGTWNQDSDMVCTHSSLDVTTLMGIWQTRSLP